MRRRRSVRSFEAPQDRLERPLWARFASVGPGASLARRPTSLSVVHGRDPRIHARGCGVDARLKADARVKPEHNEGRGGRKEPFTASTPASRMPQALVKHFSKVALLLHYFASCFQEPSATTRPPDPYSCQGAFTKRSGGPANLAA